MQTYTNLKIVQSILSSCIFAIDIETTGLRRSAEIVTVSITWLDEFRKIQSIAFFTDRIQNTKEKEERFKNDFPLLKQILQGTLFNNNFQGIVLFHNAPFDVTRLLTRFNSLIQWNENKNLLCDKHLCPNILDTASISRLLDSSKFVSHCDPDGLWPHSLKYLLKQFFPQEYSDEDETKKRPTTYDDATSGVSIRYAEIEKVLEYNGKDTIATLKIFMEMKKHLTHREWSYFERYEIPHTRNLIHLNYHGVRVDMKKLLEYEDIIHTELEYLKRTIYDYVGKEFNIDSQPALSTAIFFNSKIKYRPYRERTPDYYEIVRPYGETDKGRIKVDVKTLNAKMKQIEKIDPGSNFIPLAKNIISYLEFSKNLSKIKTLKNFIVKINDEHIIYPNVSASTKSGRIANSSPNLLGLPKKMLKNTWAKDSMEELWSVLQDKSIREIIYAPPGFKLARIDISGLDLIVLTYLAKDYSGKGDSFYWLRFIKKYKGKSVDPHFAILKKLQVAIAGEDIYQKVFSVFSPLLKTGNLNDYFATKEVTRGEITGIEFINITTEECEFIPIPDKNFTNSSKAVRSFSKKLNLATSYLMGAATLAEDLTELYGEPFGIVEAQEILDRFYKTFYQIRLLQDDVGNKIYHDGFIETLFGRKFYAEAWDNLATARSNPQNLVEVIVYHKKQYWYIQGESLFQDKDEFPLKDLKINQKRFGLRFKNISAVMLLNGEIFARKAKDAPKQRFTRKSETNLEELTDFELSRIAMTTEIDRQLQLGLYVSCEAEELRATYLHEGGFLIPEKGIAFYRTRLQDPSTRFFKKYVPLLRSVKKFFPMYCQGIANTVAITVLTDIRERIEKELPLARLLLFIHDEIIALVPDNPSSKSKIEEILVSAVENQEKKKPFDLPFSGDFKIMKSYGENE